MINLVELKPADAGIFSTLANNPSIAQYMTNRFALPFTEEQASNFIQANCFLPHKVIRGIDLQGEFIGCIGVHQLDDILIKNAELAYWIGEAYWNRGLGSAAILKMIPLAFESLEINRIFARVYGNNIPSQKVLLKCGFILEAEYKNTIFKNGKFLDELIYAVRR